MWKRIVDMLRCPSCQGKLDLIPLEEHTVRLHRKDFAKAETLGIYCNKLNEYVDTGLLLSVDCKHWYPILYGLPVLLPYETSITREFLGKYKSGIHNYASGYSSPKERPKPGERAVLRSFSREWMEYDYDGVIWGSSYEDREKTFLTEVGFGPGELRGVRFLEIGCGLGITTSCAVDNYAGDGVGIDLSLAALRATRHFANNPFLHFIQASLFHIPLRRNHFDLLYSHGVLHHTHSTQEALKAVSGYIRCGGWIYIWVYGTGTQTNSWDRRLGHCAEVVIRPLISRAPAAIATALLVPIALGYILLNRMFKATGRSVMGYNFKRALHAARDRFSPRFAFRQNFDEVERWLEELGFEKIQKLDWRTVSPLEQELFRGATAVRAQQR